MSEAPVTIEHLDLICGALLEQCPPSTRALMATAATGELIKIRDELARLYAIVPKPPEA